LRGSVVHSSSGLADPLAGVVAGDLYEREYRRRSPTPFTMPAVATGAG
jgi:hypothetical protein